VDAKSIGLDLIGGVLSEAVVQVATIVVSWWAGVCLLSAAEVEFIVVTAGIPLKGGPGAHNPVIMRHGVETG
jgi:hypothetical protein